MVKRAVDICGAVIGLLGAAPVLFVLAVAIKIDSPGPVFYTQWRAGRNRRPFRVYKLRSMAVGGGPVAPITGDADPRVTRVGRIMRLTRLDEVPQLVNVLKGEMSLVGPRPEVVTIVEENSAQWREVLSVRPGLTGPTQIAWLDEASRIPHHVDTAEYYRSEILPQKLRSDLSYIRTRNLARDLGWLARTPWHIAKTWRARRGRPPSHMAP